MSKKIITIEDLALMVGKGFAEMDKRFDSIEEELKKIRSEIEYIKIELGKRIDKFTHKDLEFRVEKLEEKLKKYEKMFPQVA